MRRERRATRCRTGTTHPVLDMKVRFGLDGVVGHKRLWVRDEGRGRKGTQRQRVQERDDSSLLKVGAAGGWAALTGPAKGSCAA